MEINRSVGVSTVWQWYMRFMSATTGKLEENSRFLEKMWESLANRVSPRKACVCVCLDFCPLKIKKQIYVNKLLRLNGNSGFFFSKKLHKELETEFSFTPCYRS